MSNHATDEDIVKEAPEQVVEFSIGDQRYCVAIEYVWELVELPALTPVPEAPDHVEGVMDLRGTTTTVIDLRHLLDIDPTGEQRRVIIFDDGTGEQGEIGWAVDEVHEVRAVDPEAIDQDETSQMIAGMINRDGEFTIWLDPTYINTLS